MKKNVGISDRIIRFVFFDLLLGASFMGFDIPPMIAYIAFPLAVYLLITVIFGYSPLYSILKLNTVYKEEGSNSNIV